MLTRLKLTNFQRHEDLEIHFTSGLQVIRGANEGGKSTLFRAVGYALGGSRMLPDTLEETVTWEKPVSSLKVELDFTHGGQAFTIVRKKSGAELTGPGVTASGQAEVSSFVEQLFGASGLILQATMLANQSSLKDGLDSSAMPLIEKLANMSLIDHLIVAVQEKLPSGNTKALEAQLQAAMQTVEPVLEDAKARAAVDTADADYRTCFQFHSAALSALQNTQHLAQLGQRKQAHNRALDGTRSSLTNQLAAAQQVQAPAEPKLSVGALEAERQQVQELQVRYDAYQVFLGLNENRKHWGLASDLQDHFTAAEGRYQAASRRAHELQVQIASYEAKRITETACGLCGKDLTDVPEVVAKNAATDAMLQSLNAELVEKRLIEQAQRKILQDLAAVGNASGDLRSAARACRNFVELDETQAPVLLKWLGDVPVKPDAEMINTQLSEARVAQAAYDAAVKKYNAAQATIASAVEQLEQLQPQYQDVLQEEVAAMLSLDGARDAELAARNRKDQANRTLLMAKAEFEQLFAVFSAQKAAWDKAVEQREGLQNLLKQYEFNNELISKLREARPAVARKLWALVLTGVSHYFSQIRGVQSTVTRGEKGFRIDGKPMSSFSGSAQDSLGLAIRLMLQKTFLPNIGFMMADEPGAACDDTRESDMLGVLAASGLEQVILVTHSDLADSFASNVVQL